MRTPDANGWFDGLEDAPKDERILVLLPDDENEEQDHEIAQWDDITGRWEGEWRNLLAAEGSTEPHPLASVEPTHWKPLDLPAEFEAEAQVEMMAAVPGH